MNVLLIILLTLLALFALLLYFRKMHWDVVHNNLLELSDDIGGEVYRRNFSSRPIFHGTFGDKELTINFSSARNALKRQYYVDVSWGKIFPNSFTVSSKELLQTDEWDISGEYEELNSEDLHHYLLMKSGNSPVYAQDKKDQFLNALRKLRPFNYLLAGNTGVLFEAGSENIAMATQYPKLKQILQALQELEGSVT